MIEAAHYPGFLAVTTEAVVSYWRKNVWLVTLTVLYVLTSGFVVYAGWFEQSWLSYPTLPFIPKKAAYYVGEPAVIKVMRCNSSDRERTYNISHVLIRHEPSTEQCPRRTVLPPGLVEVEAGCTSEDSAANPIPPNACPGTYHVEGQAETQGMLRTILVPWRSGDFIVKAKEQP